MNRFEERIIDKINYFDETDKNGLLENEDRDIDKGIRELTDAINSISFLTTMNSCQGALIEAEAQKHSKRTYVDFYVLDHKYHLANLLMVKLTSEFANGLECKVRFEPDFDFIGENEVEDNGYVNFRYKIRFEDLEIFEDVVSSVYEFVENIE